MDKTPVLGDFMARFLKGGATPGQMTLSRFFVIHVMVLPAALMGLAGLHIFLFRKAGPAGPFRGTVEGIKAKTDYFFPRQIWKDIVGMVVVFLSICSLAFWEPVVLLEEATPDPGDYHPEPEWYFLFLFQCSDSRCLPVSSGSSWVPLPSRGLYGALGGAAFHRPQP